jgi:2',5'-phosphodiesterase
VFAEYLAPHLALAGYGGAYTNKQGRVREGSAMFWRRSRLQLAARHDVLLRVRGAPRSVALHGGSMHDSWCSYVVA